MEKFKKRNLFDIYLKMSLEEVNEYYQKLREYELKIDDPIKGIKIRKILYSIVKLFLIIDEIMKKREVIILNDSRDLVFDCFTDNRREFNKKSPKVYSCTHIGRYDIETAIKAVNEQCYFVMADPGESYQNLDGLLLRMNGISWFDMDNSLDRHATNIRQIKVLSQGGNELVFPEQAYNLEPSKPVGDLHPGPFRRAIKTGAYVIPISMEQYEDDDKKKYIVNIGSMYDVSKMSIQDDVEVSNFIQSEMIRLKKEIWNVFGGDIIATDCESLSKEQLMDYKSRIDFIMRDVPSYYTIQQIVDEFYNPSDLMIKSLRSIDYIK